MANVDDDGCGWSEETYTLKQIIKDVGLPTVVKVSEGIYGTSESVTFSNGDILRLDFEKTIEKVAAKVCSPGYDDADQSVREDDDGYLKSSGPILIPTGYIGKLQVVRPDAGYRKYYSVQELVNHFPRYVRVETSVQAKYSKDNAMLYIKVGSRLELDRAIPPSMLVCIYNGEKISLDCKSRGTFVLLPDDNFYNLKEIINRLPLPQCVRFMDAEFNKVMTETLDLDEALVNITHYSGLLKLERVVNQKVVVGHHKPAPTLTDMSQFCRRSLAILPLDNKDVNEVVFRVPQYDESNEYVFLLAKSFSGISVEDIDGGLYLEFEKNPKIHLLQSIHEALGASARQDNKPPPVPKRTYKGNPKASIKGLTTKTYKITREAPAPPPEENLYEIQEEATVPPQTPTRNPPSPPFKYQGKHVQQTNITSPKTPDTNQPNSPFRYNVDLLGASQQTEKDIEGLPNSPVTCIADLFADGASIKLPESSAEAKHIFAVPKAFRHQLKIMQKQLVSLVRSKSVRDKDDQEVKRKPSKSPTRSIPKNSNKIEVKIKDTKRNDSIEESEEPGTHDYDYPDWSTLKINKQEPPSASTNNTLKASTSDTRQKMDSSSNTGPQFVSSERITNPSNQHRIPQSVAPVRNQTQVRPCARVQPQGQGHIEHQHSVTSGFVFNKLSVKDVVKHLNECGLVKMANICEENLLDGSVLDTLSNEEVTKMFSLSAIELKKFELLKKEGWKPRVT